MKSYFEIDLVFLTGCKNAKNLVKKSKKKFWGGFEPNLDQRAQKNFFNGQKNNSGRLGLKRPIGVSHKFLNKPPKTNLSTPSVGNNKKRFSNLYSRASISLVGDFFPGTNKRAGI